jgi:hypothetical protein
MTFNGLVGTAAPAAENINFVFQILSNKVGTNVAKGEEKPRQKMKWLPS